MTICNLLKMEIFNSSLGGSKLKYSVPGGQCKHQMGYLMLTLTLAYTIFEFGNPK